MNRNWGIVPAAGLGTRIQPLAFSDNVCQVTHISPKQHAEFYSSSRITLNLTRREMVNAGYSPSVRLFEAAACDSAVISDNCIGLDSFFLPGEEILVAENTDQVRSYLDDGLGQLARIGQRARGRALSEHHPHRRAEQFEAAVETA